MRGASTSRLIEERGAVLSVSVQLAITRHEPQLQGNVRIFSILYGDVALVLASLIDEIADSSMRWMRRSSPGVLEGLNRRRRGSNLFCGSEDEETGDSLVVSFGASASSGKELVLGTGGRGRERLHKDVLA